MSKARPQADSPEQTRARRELGQELMEFMQKIMANGELAEQTPESREAPQKIIYDDPLRQHTTEHYRQAVEQAAAVGIETALTWHTLGVWTEEGRERIGYFSRALQCVEEDRDGHLRPQGAHTRWGDLHMRAECLYEIGRVHAHEGDPAVARDFLERALPLAQAAEGSRGPAGVTHEDGLEGQIAELLVQLPDEVA